MVTHNGTALVYAAHRQAAVGVAAGALLEVTANPEGLELRGLTLSELLPAKAGDPLQARFILEKMLGYANHVGLYAEQLGPEGEHLGNFPQAFTHLGLISAAFAIDRTLRGR